VQWSDVVHAFASLHVVPSVLAGFEQTPVAGLHVPASWHWSCAVQVFGFAPVHVPDWQVSVCVQPLPSLHALPFALGGFEHAPDSTPHAPARWHWSDAEQLIELPPVQKWLWQVDDVVHGFWSSHSVPFMAVVHCAHGILIFAVRQPPGMKQWPASPL
jgi:hypothetical protein